MKKKTVMLCSLLAILGMSACSEGNDPQTRAEEDSQSTMVVKFDFEGTTMNPQTRAPQSTAIPETSWSNIKQLQFFLYDASNVVRYSAVVDNLSSTNHEFTYTGIPVGTYTLVAVANAKSSTDAINTYVDGGTTPTEWDMWNVRQKNMSNLILKQKAGSFPTFTGTTLSADAAFAEPSEIFMGSASNITIATGTTATPPAIALKREVSLMRVRIDPKEGQNGVDNETSVDYTQDASIMIYCLPNSMSILAGNSGGVNATSTKTNILSVGSGTVYNTADPTTGYNAGGTILSGNFTMWKDIVVFPNNGGRANDSQTTADAAAQRQYYIVVSALGKTGHVLADGTTLTADTPIYWSGTIKENFVPNVIREVNLTLRSGGTADVPTQPTESGDLDITVSEPTPWDSNIVDSNIIL
jgi:hypothetical protein